MFRFGGEKKKPAGPSVETAAPSGASPRTGGGPGNKRTAFRAEVEFPIFYELVGRPGERRGQANDLSAGGLRLLLDEDLVREQELLLHFTLPSDFLEHFPEFKEVSEDTPFGPRKKRVKKPPRKFSEMHVRAKAMMTFFNLPRSLFVHGMQFVDISEGTMDEIQRFAHYWQLNQLRIKTERDKRVIY
ncbi:MAG: PilZ domain-containing protein [Candidatus Eremiobacteraeota bacterium]|nr:PilZ domain-containing protein [Candidatus Eremiobacteraeota bacterium]